MKTTLKILSIGIALMILITGCKKNQSSNPTEQKSPVDKQKIESVVKYCTSRVLNKVKTTDSIPVDSLTYYLEATSNYVYSIASANGELQKIDSNFFKVQYNNDKVAMTDLSSVYSELIDSVRASFYRIQDRNKNLVVVIAENVGSQNNIISLKVTSIILYGNNQQIGRFDTTDYWKWMGAGSCNGGKCGPYYLQGDPCLDAAKMIQNRVMLRKGLLAGCYLPPFQNLYFTSNQFPNPNFSGTNYNYFYKCFFWNSPSNPATYHSCLMPFEMNRYLELAEYVVYTVDTQPSGGRPDGYSFMSLILNGDLVVGGGLELDWGYIYYGIYVAGGYQSAL